MTLLIMNNEITPDETKSTITSLKSGKVSLDEMIANEILKLLNSDDTSFLTNLFNICLKK